ncbi:MAG: branched-chain amino acid transport system permease protein [Candidatus Atribacteria bacterium]|nr:branched-chain amino acid transport system permease protein [Candidatus Atribacteria bacterium]
MEIDIKLAISAFVLGLGMSGVYFLLTVGLSLCYGLMRVISLDQFFYYALGAHITYTLINITGNFWLGLLTGVIAVLFIAYSIEKLIYRQIYKKPIMFSMILSFGVNLAGVGIIKYIWGLAPKPVKAPIGGTIPILGTDVPGYRVFVILLAILIYLGVWYFLNKTIVGTAVRAGIDDAEKVEALGINVYKLFTLTFILAASLSALAGGLHAPMIMVVPDMGLSITSFAFMVVIIGGLGSIKGTLISSFIVGQIVSFGSLIWAPLANIAPFILMLIVLLIKPTGLYGSKYLRR